MQLLDMSKVSLDSKTRLSIGLVSVLLGVNSFNVILDKFIQILVTVEIFGKGATTSIIFDVY